jgi:hypothetical protein
MHKYPERQRRELKLSLAPLLYTAGHLQSDRPPRAQWMVNYFLEVYEHE